MSTKRVLLITGANTGLGYEVIRSLSQSPNAYTILLGGRSIDKAKVAAEKAQKEFPSSASDIETVQIDIEDDESIAKLFEYVSSKYGRLDILINNAGAMFERQHAEGKITMREMWDKSWNVNTTSTQIMTHTFVPLLLKSSDPRLIFIASGTSTLAGSLNAAYPMNQPPAKGWPKQQAFSFSSYRSSKTGMNMMMREWSRILAEDGVKVWCISPGYLATGLGGDQEFNKKMGAEDPVLGGNFVKDVVEGKWDEDTGKIVSRRGIQPW